MGRRSEACRGTLSRQGFAHLFPRRRRLRQSRCLRAPRSRRDQIRHSPADEPRLAGADRPSAQTPGWPCRTCRGQTWEGPRSATGEYDLSELELEGRDVLNAQVYGFGFGNFALGTAADEITG